VYEEKVVTIGWKQPELFASLAFVIIRSGKIDRITVVNPDVICNGTQRNHASCISDPGLVTLRGSSKFQHMLLFTKGNETTFQ